MNRRINEISVGAVLLVVFACGSEENTDASATGGAAGQVATGGVAGGGTDGGGAAGAAATGGVSGDAATGGTGAIDAGAPCATLLAASFGNHACARKTDGTLWCWGENSRGQVGDGTQETPRTAPVQVSTLGASVAAAALGKWHSCALKTDDTLWCWGANSSGQLGDGSSTPAPSPLQVTSLGTSVAQVALGAWHSCARKKDGTLWCWGENSQGQLGDGTTQGQPLPTQVTSLGSDVVDVKVGYRTTCVRRGNGSVWCWGLNSFGQVGNGTTTTPQPQPVEVTALGTGVSALALGLYHSCALKQDETLWCWGRNDFGQLGDGTLKDSSVPVKVLVKSVAAIDRLGVYASCALAKDQSVWCWGSADRGNLGTGSFVTSSQGCGQQCEPTPVRALLGCP